MSSDEKEVRAKDPNMEPISIRLSVQNKTYSAGSRIGGSISLNVEPRATGCTDFSGIHFLFEGKETVEFKHRLWGVKYPPEEDEAIFFSLDTEVVRFSSPLIAGQCDYPFSFELPEGSLPGSMCCKVVEGTGDFTERSECEVKYDLKAYLSTTKCDPQWDPRDSTQPIHITASSKASNDNCKGGTTIVGPTTIKINSLLGNKGYMELGLDTDTNALCPGPGLVVGVTCSNLSTVPIKEVLVQWIETVEWGQSNSFPEEVSHRILAETSVIASSLNSVWQPKPTGKQMNGGRSAKVNPINLSGTRERDRITTRLLFPENDARDSYEGELIHVCHSIQVVAVTEGKYSTNPTICALMQGSPQQLFNTT